MDNRLPLEGIRVIDFTSVLLGPYCTRVLAQFGADVVKVESPLGDVSRRLGLGKTPNMASSHLQLNKGKRSIAIDLKSAASTPVLTRLIEGADVVVLNARATSADRIGLSYDAVKADNPGVVYCRMPGFGAGGPYESLKAYDDVIQAASGLAHLQSVATGRPAYVAGAIADKVVGLVSSSAILAGLLARERNGGLGCEIEVPMFETSVDYFLIENLGGRSYEPPIGPALYARTVAPERRPFQTADGAISAVVYSDIDWKRFLEEVDRTELMDDSRLSSIQSRTTHTNFAYGLLNEIFVERTSAEWIDVLRRSDIAAMPVNTVDELFVDPHLQSVGMFRTQDHPTEGAIRVVRPPVMFDGHQPPSERPAPLLGQHTVEVLVECGFDENERARLVESGAVRVPCKAGY